MTTKQRIRLATGLALRTPSIAIVSLLYATAVYASTLRAGVMDIGDPWWVMTVGIVLLLSPIYHAFVIQAAAARMQERPFSLRDIPMESFGSLVAGELIVNAAVAIGSLLFFLPGIYVGLRSIYYKQAIVLHKARSLAAVRESFALTVEPRSMLWLLLLLAVAYGIVLATDFFLIPATTAFWIHPVAVVISTAFLAWVNVYITLSFVDAAEHLSHVDESSPTE